MVSSVISVGQLLIIRAYRPYGEENLATLQYLVKGNIGAWFATMNSRGSKRSSHAICSKHRMRAPQRLLIANIRSHNEPIFFVCLHHLVV